MHLGLSACITVEAPKAESDEEGARRGDDEAGDGGATVTRPKRSGGAGASADAGVATMQRDGAMDEDPDEGEDESDTMAEARDGGASEAASQDAGMQSAMHEQTDGGSESVEDQPHYCGILRVTVRVCNGSQHTDYGETCVADATDCLALLPPDERVDYNEYCFTRTEYEVFGDGPQVGTCAQYDAYWAGTLECLLDKHCGEGERCVDNACMCPDGVACVCPNCGPQPGRCDGQVHVALVGAGPCDENRECVYEEERTDCAAQELECDASEGCVEPKTPPPPPPPSDSPGGVPGGPGTP
jgi:hypothetical protein